MRDTNNRTRRRAPIPSRSMAAATRARRSEYEQWDYDDSYGCHSGCTGCSNGAETVMSLTEVVTELFELINEVAFPEVIDLAKKEEKPKTNFDNESTYREDEDTMFMQTNEYNNIKQAKVFLGFIGHVEMNVKQNLPAALERPSFELPRSKSSLFGMLSQEEDEPEAEGRDDYYERGGAQHYGEHNEASIAKASSERNLPLNPNEQSNDVSEGVFVEGSINEKKSDLTDERSESELEGKYKTYIKTAMSSTEPHDKPCLLVGDQDMQISGAGKDRDIEQKEVQQPHPSPTEAKTLGITDCQEKVLDEASNENDASVSASEDQSFIELEDASITYSIGHMDSALEESVTYHSRDSVTSHTKDSVLEESVTCHSRESAFDESVTFHTKDSAMEESVTYHSKDITLEDSVTYHSKDISLEETDHSISYEEEESYESVTDYDEESYESVTKHSISVASSEVESSEEEKSAREEPETLVEKEITKPEEAKKNETPQEAKNETPQLCSIYDNLYPKDSIFSFVTKDESGSLFDFDESPPSPENETMKPPTSVIVQNKSTEVSLDGGDQMQDDHDHDDKESDDKESDEKVDTADHDHKHVHGTVEERDGAHSEQKEENEVCKPGASKLAPSNTKETINAPKIPDTLQTGDRKTQVKKETSNSYRSYSSEESTKILDKPERRILKRNNSGRRKIPSRVRMYHQHRRNILKMQNKTE